MKDYLIKIGADTLLNELTWCATRYCIGRKTYVTSYAKDYCDIIRANRDKFNPERLKFFARDIRANVSDVVGWYSDVRVENAYNDRIVYDAYTLLTKHLQGVTEPSCNVRYIVDCISGEVTTEAYEPKDYATYFDPQSCEYDLLPWVRLANCIDRQFEVTCENDGNVEKAICIQDPDGRYTCADDWNRYADPKYIKEIKPIEL